MCEPKGGQEAWPETLTCYQKENRERVLALALLLTAAVTRPSFDHEHLAWLEDWRSVFEEAELRYREVGGAGDDAVRGPGGEVGIHKY